MTLKLDVLIDVISDRLEDGQLPGLPGQWAQERYADFSEDADTAAGQLLKRLVVELHQQRRNGLVDRYGLLAASVDSCARVFHNFFPAR